MMRLKGGETFFLCQNSLKSISRQPRVRESWFKKILFTMRVVRNIHDSDKRKCPKNTIFCFFGPHNDKIA